MSKFLKSLAFLVLAIVIAGAAIWVSFSLTPTTRKPPQISLKSQETITTSTTETTQTETSQTSSRVLETTLIQTQAVVTQAPVVETAAPETVIYYYEEVVTEQPVETTAAYTYTPSENIYYESESTVASPE